MPPRMKQTPFTMAAELPIRFEEGFAGDGEAEHVGSGEQADREHDDGAGPRSVRRGVDEQRDGAGLEYEADDGGPLAGVPPVGDDVDQ